MKQVVLVVEDEKNISNLITAILQSNEYQVISSQTGREAVALAASHSPDVILLDLGLPDIDGVEVLRRIREFCSVPIIVVSARDHEREKVQALDLGADDYITKPFGSSELLARIRTAVRHVNSISAGGKASSKISVGELSIDIERRVVTIYGLPVHFTPIEYKIMVLLGKHAGKVLTYDFIMREVWGPYVNENKALRVNMANIRRKIEKNPAEPEYIVTEMGVGYRLVD